MIFDPLSDGASFKEMDVRRAVGPALPHQALNAVVHLRASQSVDLLVPFAVDWMVIGACLVIWNSMGSFFILLPIVWVIASRQHALAVLMHETVHSRAPIARMLGCCCAWSIFISWGKYRENHLTHHRYVNTGRDPDLAFKRATKPDDWRFPRTGASTAILLFKDLVGNGVLSNLRRMIRLGGSQIIPNQKSAQDNLTFRLTYTVLFIGGFLALFGVRSLALLWILPIFTVLPFLLRVRSIAEHFAIPGYAAEGTRNVKASWIEREVLGFGPHSVGFHLVHHLIPNIPGRHLAKSHELLLANWKVYQRQFHHCDGYAVGTASLLADLTGETRRRDGDVYVSRTT